MEAGSRLRRMVFAAWRLEGSQIKEMYWLRRVLSRVGVALVVLRSLDSYGIFLNNNVTDESFSVYAGVGCMLDPRLSDSSAQG